MCKWCVIMSITYSQHNRISVFSYFAQSLAKNCQLQSIKNYKKQSLLESHALCSVIGRITCLLLARALRTFSLEWLCNCFFPKQTQESFFAPVSAV